DKQSADSLSFCLVVSFTCKLIIKSFPSIDPLYIQSNFFVSGQYCFKFIFAQYAIINKNSIKMATDSTTDQCCCNSGIYSATQCHHYFTITDLCFQLCNRIRNKMSRCPILLTSANIHQKIMKDLFAFNRMIYFRMKLQTL